MADDLDLDLDDFGIEVDDAQQSATPENSAHRAAVRILVIDPGHRDSQVMRQIELAGFATSQVETGGQAMQAISAGQFAALCCVAWGDDNDWIRFLASGVHMRFDNFPCLGVARTPTDSERDRLQALGLDLVLPSPLPPITALGARLDGLLGLQSPSIGAQPSSTSELALLKRRLRDVEEAERLKSQELDQIKAQFLQAVDEVSQRTSESTGLRSEVSILRDRSSVMKDRLIRAQQEIQALKQQNAKLSGGPMELPPLAVETGEAARKVRELKGLLAALLPFDQALEQALNFLEELAIVSGPRAQLLQRHLRQLKMMREVFARIRARLKATPSA